MKLNRAVQALTVLGGVLLVAWFRPAEGPTEPETVARPAAPASTAAVIAAGASAVVQVAVAAGPAASATPVDKELVEVCGVGTVRRSELDPGEGQQKPAWMQALDRQAEQGLADMLKRLEAGTLKQRVAGAVLGKDVQAAAQLAASSDDAATYRIALLTCRKDATYRQAYGDASQQRARLAASAAGRFEIPELPVPGAIPSACAAINLERLVLLDPGDAWPWLLRLNDAHGDETAISQALYQVAQRRRLSANTRALTATLADVVGADPTLGETWALFSAISTDAASNWDGSLVSVGRACRAVALRDANRRQLCEQVARRAPDMVAEAMDSRALHALEERLGLPHSPQALSRQDADRALGSITDASMRWMAEPTCAHVGDMGRHLVKLAREGELAGMRAYLKATPASAPR